MTELVEKQAAIDALHKWEMVYTWDETCLEDREKCYAPSEVIEDLPAAEPEGAERKIGHWVVRNEYSMWPVLCSECGERQMNRTKFCPDCGAPMDLKGEENG